MKKNVSLVFFILYATFVWGQSGTKGGIQFFQGSWKQLLEEARAKDKMIFIDVYTDWCGPCKYMDKSVFTEQLVAEKYNALFLNYKVDAEKGEGIDIAKKFGVNAYPTFLFLNSSGYLIHKVVGEREKGPFIAVAEAALKAGVDDNNLGNFEMKFNEGDRTSLFLKAYLNRLNEVNMDNSLVLDEYFKTIPNQLLKEDATLLYLAQQVAGARTAALMHLIHHYDEMSIDSKEKTSNLLFEKLVRNAGGTALKEKRLLEYAELVAFGRQLPGLSANQKSFLNRIDLIYSGLIRDYEGVKKAGYLMAAVPFSIPDDTIRQEDKKRYDKIMKPFLSGEIDTTKVPGFEEEKKYFPNLYSREITEQLYTAAEAFTKLPSSEKQALTDALGWAKRCEKLQPDVKVFVDLVNKLKGYLSR
ncbi:thioredoxin family protein [Pedobacter nyackensis]|uniref:thioredoxin family protein n=1 Tax=Pedobacter nyackensis TaxID=475255 RepID=UPI00292F2617|nr:thioredoxin family protein [Pedobacter nyackensis]